MTIKDLFVTPIFLLVIILLAYWVRPYVTSLATKKYFFPALLAKLIGAIVLGMVYQFYYASGDTFIYFEHGSRWIWEALINEPLKGIQLLLDSGGNRKAETFHYNQHIWYYKDTRSFLIVKIASVIDLVTFHTYTSTALFFALFSFSGLWAFFVALVKKYRNNLNGIAVAILFIPSVVFWGSGILKDTVTIGALGWVSYSLINLIDINKRRLIFWIILVFFSALIFKVKSYIIICYLPMVSLWLYLQFIHKIKNTAYKILVAPLLVVIFGGVGFYVFSTVANQTETFAFENIAERARITAYDIRYGWGARTGGDGGYDLGELDGSWDSMIRLAPQAVVVSLFRPYPWEIKNPLMLLASIESTLMLVFSFWYLIVKKRLTKVFQDPFLVFCMSFAVIFAFAVGVSTYNFGTLMRYKIPMMPFFALLLVLTGDKSSRSVQF
ncbi:MAG: hypothetical protein ABJ004_10785 [Cyclobacteriaceae bacterium]